MINKTIVKHLTTYEISATRCVPRIIQDANTYWWTQGIWALSLQFYIIHIYHISIRVFKCMSDIYFPCYDVMIHLSIAVTSYWAHWCLITSVSIVYSTVCPGADERKHQSSASLAFVRGIHRWPVNSPHKGPVTPKMFPSDDVIMDISIMVYLASSSKR